MKAGKDKGKMGDWVGLEWMNKKKRFDGLLVMMIF